MSNIGAEIRIKNFIALIKRVDPSVDWHRESLFRGTPIWSLCWPEPSKYAGGYTRGVRWCEEQLEKLNQEEFKDD